MLRLDKEDFRLQQEFRIERERLRNREWTVEEREERLRQFEVKRSEERQTAISHLVELLKKVLPKNDKSSKIYFFLIKILGFFKLMNNNRALSKISFCVVKVIKMLVLIIYFVLSLISIKIRRKVEASSLHRCLY
jgi:hypothetical protein